MFTSPRDTLLTQPRRVCIGPVTAGLVGWIGGIGALVLAALWITAKRRVHK